MQTDTALVRSDCTVELYTVTGIYLNLTFIVNPWYTEFELSFRIYHSFQKSILSVFFFICLDNDSQRLQNLFYCLMKFRFRWILLYNFGNNLIYV